MKEEVTKKPNFFKRHWKGCLGTFIILLSIPIIFALLAKFVFMKPSMVRVTLSEAQAKDATFDLYLGSASADGTGNYIKLNKAGERTWEAKNTFGEDEKDINGMILMKARPSDLTVPESIAATKPMSPRVNGEEFQKGVLVVDYWAQEWGEKQISQTNQELNRSNVKWAFLAPPWDFKSFDPPKISGDIKNMEYSEEQLKNHIKKLKADGIDVVVGPQLCCTPQPAKYEGKTKEWWDQYFSEYEKFMVYNARVSGEAGAKIFVFGIPGQSHPFMEGVPSDIEARWEKVLTSVRGVFHGKVALFDYVCCGAFDEGLPGFKSSMFREHSALYEKFDLFNVSMWNPVSRSDNPTQEELDNNVAKVMDDKIKYIYDEYKKPVFIQTAYRSADGASIGTQKYSVDLVSKNPDWKEFAQVEAIKGGLFKSNGALAGKVPFLTYDAREQAMVYEAIYKAVADRGWITGVYPFVYHMVGYDFPRQPDYDIRRKPAEKIMAEWYKYFK